MLRRFANAVPSVANCFALKFMSYFPLARTCWRISSKSKAPASA
jgi:hypothetical protein